MYAIATGTSVVSAVSLNNTREYADAIELSKNSDDKMTFTTIGDAIKTAIILQNTLNNKSTFKVFKVQ